MRRRRLALPVQFPAGRGTPRCKREKVPRGVARVIAPSRAILRDLHSTARRSSRPREVSPLPSKSVDEIREIAPVSQARSGAPKPALGR